MGIYIENFSTSQTLYFLLFYFFHSFGWRVLAENIFPFRYEYELFVSLITYILRTYTNQTYKYIIHQPYRSITK